MVDVNGVFDNAGNFLPLGCFQRFFTTGDIVETGANYPAPLDREVMQGAYNLTELAASSLGISRGPVKADLVLTRDGFLILELAPRLHGPKGTLWLSSIVDSRSHLETMIDVISNRSYDPELAFTKTGFAAYRALISTHRRHYTPSNLNKLRAMEEVEDLLVLKENYFPRGILTNANVPAYFFTRGKSRSDTSAKLDRVSAFFTAAR